MLKNNKKLSDIFSKVSLVIILFTIMVIVDIPLKFIPYIKISTGAYFLPFYLCPIGLFLSVLSLKLNKNKIGYIALILNVCMVLLEAIFMVVGFKFLVH
ncbi:MULTISPECIES: hypothetical protein [Clostridium]|uniref:Uncharacterized protein n=1 Tax=Clostridium cibarium TaxID=2762247 RepID=A0ABR8PWE0_9CLOT|nr:MULTISPECIES: hypothetical protein [Clostridium]MBD7912497.1 hypothetical protein [Clostridium cibarium]